MYEFTQFDQINPYTGEGYPIGMNPPPSNESVIKRDNWHRKNNPPEVEKKIIGVIDAILCPAAPGNPAVTVSIFDTTTHIDRAIVQLHNSTGGASELGNFSIKGKIVYQISNAANGRGGSLYWEHTDYGDIEKYGEKEMKVANEFIFSGAQVEDIGDYVRKEMKPHDMYTLALRGYHPYFSPGDLWTLTVDHSLPASTSEQELIDTDVQICGVSIRKEPKTIGETILSVRVPSGAWSKTTSTRAKVAVSGLPNQQLNRTNEITIAPRDNPNQANYHCTGTNDELVIVSAIEKLAADGGGRIILLRGSFYLDGDTDPGATKAAIYGACNNISIVGAGIGATILYNPANLQDKYTIRLNGTDNTVSDLSIISTAGTYSDYTYGIYMASSSGTVERCSVSVSYLAINARTIIDCITTARIGGQFIIGNTINRDLTGLTWNVGDAIYTGIAAAKIRDNVITITGDDTGHVEVITCGYPDCAITDNTITMDGTYVIASTASYIFSLGNSPNISVTGNHVFMSGTYTLNNNFRGVIHTSDNATYSGNIFEVGGTWTINASNILSVIYVNGALNSVSHNKVIFTGTWTAGYYVFAIHLVGNLCTANSNVLSGDNFTGAGTYTAAGIYDVGDYNILTGNRAYGFTNSGAGTAYGLFTAATASNCNYTGNNWLGNDTNWRNDGSVTINVGNQY